MDDLIKYFVLSGLGAMAWGVATMMAVTVYKEVVKKEDVL